MEYKVILKNDKYALIERGTGIREYAVVYGLDEERKEWDWTVAAYAFYYSKAIVAQYTQAEALARAVDIFRLRTEENYILKIEFARMLLTVNQMMKQMIFSKIIVKWKIMNSHSLG